MTFNNGESRTDAFDIFLDLAAGDGLAEVGTNVGYGLQFGMGKVSTYVKVHCNQDALTIRRAAQATREVAREASLDGMTQILEDVESKQ